MRNTKIILLFSLSFSFVVCCSDNSQTPPIPDVKPPAPVVDTSEETIPTGAPKHVETISVAGNSYRVTVKGSIAPNAILDVSIIQVGGTLATAIRVWVGEVSGVGSVKTRVHSHGERSHARPQSPATLPENSALWIEVQRTNGATESVSVHLN